jgi:divalent metal cation (Fe/Co/Zn/Cd) transporter
VVIVGEDIAALGGLTLAFGFITLSVITSNPVYDAFGSIAIGSLLVVVALLVGREVASMLVGQSVEPHVLEAMRAHLQERPEVDQVFNVLTQQLGSEAMVAVKARIRPEWADQASLVAAINRVERSFREAFPQVRWVFFEPDLSD